MLMPSSCSNGIRSADHNSSGKRNSKRALPTNGVHKVSASASNQPTKNHCNKPQKHSEKSSHTEPPTEGPNFLNQPPTSQASDAIAVSPSSVPSSTEALPVVISVSQVTVKQTDDSPSPTDTAEHSQPSQLVDSGLVLSSPEQVHLSEQPLLNPLEPLPPPPGLQDAFVVQQPFLPLPYTCPCTVSNCQTCYQQLCATGPNTAQTTNVPFIAPRQLVPSNGTAASCVSNASVGAPCYIFMDDAQKQLFSAQMALSQMSLNAPMASDCAIGVPLVQANNFAREVPVQGSFVPNAPQPNALQMLAQSQFKGGSLVNTNAMYTLPHNMLPPVSDPNAVPTLSSTTAGSTGCATPIQSVYNPTPSNASTTGSAADQISVPPTHPVENINAIPPWPSTGYFDATRMWFPPVYPQPFYPSLPTNQLFNYTNPGTMLPIAPTYPTPSLTNLPCDKVPTTLTASVYQPNLSTPLYANGIRLPVKPFCGFGQASNIYSTNPALAVNSTQPLGNNWLTSACYQQLLLQALANARNQGSGAGQYHHPILSYGLRPTDRSSNIGNGRKRVPVNSAARINPAKEFDESELAKLQLCVNPPELDPSLMIRTRYFVIKSDNEYNVHQSIRYGVWCSTRTGNQCLDEAFRSVQVPRNQTLSSDAAYCDQNSVITTSSSRVASGPLCQIPGHILLFFSVRSTDYLSGVAEMIGPVNPQKRRQIWQDSRFRGEIPIQWLYIKNVPNSLMKHIIVDSRPVTLLRDTSEILPCSKGEELLTIIHKYCVESVPSVHAPYDG